MLIGSLDADLTGSDAVVDALLVRYAGDLHRTLGFDVVP